MNPPGPFTTTEDFDVLTWHDIYVHGFRFASFDAEQGSAELVFDIDYTLDAERSEGNVRYTVCPAELTFHRVFGLKFELDYTEPTAGMCPFAIDVIERTPITFVTGYKSFRWNAKVDWPRGSIAFEAPGFTLRPVGTPVVREGFQFIPSEQRARSPDSTQ